MNLSLTRNPGPDYTMGRLTVGDTEFHTIERPWIPSNLHAGGQPFESCVPYGTYRLMPHDSHKFGQTWALVNEDLDVYHYPQDGKLGRYAILLHSGNVAANFQGCIGVGMQSTDGWIGQSQKAMRVLRSILPHEEHTLTITHPHGTL
jgi:hypothetical protein